MNQFRDLLTVALVALGIGLFVSDPNDWTWAHLGGAYVVSALAFLGTIHPFASVICIALAGMLFMTRLKY